MSFENHAGLGMDERLPLAQSKLSPCGSSVALPGKIVSTRNPSSTVPPHFAQFVFTFGMMLLPERQKD
jgi:hypothetical protein